MLLLIDNFDSFSHNLARYFVRLGQEAVVRRNDEVTVESVKSLAPTAIVISPGPCGPQEAGCCLQIAREFVDSIPMLGVCLGHQVIAEALGAQVVRSERPAHGRASQIYHTSNAIFAGIDNPTRVGRYHSLIVNHDSLPACLETLAQTEHGVNMAFQHRQRPVFGVQFHPESILTPCGYHLLANFLRLAGQAVPNDTLLFETEQRITDDAHESWPWPDRPITF